MEYPDKHILSFSGGKDSTALFLMILEKGLPLDEVVFFDTGWEFPAMLDHIDLVEKNTGFPITRLKPKISFEYLMLEKIVVPRSHAKNQCCFYVGYGWPAWERRWCTRCKITTLDKHCGNAIRYVGVAADEPQRSTQNYDFQIKYPLIDWGMTEKDCFKYCKQAGYTWGNLSKIFDRMSCFCCPLQTIDSLRRLRLYSPELWNKMLQWDTRMRDDALPFKKKSTVLDLETRFAKELECNDLIRKSKLGSS